MLNGALGVFIFNGKQRLEVSGKVCHRDRISKGRGEGVSEAGLLVFNK